MEVAGVAIGVFPTILNLIQFANRVTSAYRLQLHSSPEIAQIVQELNDLGPILLAARDIIERQATDDADIRTLSSLTSSSRHLEETLAALEASSSRWVRQSSKRSKFSRILFSKEHQETIDRIHRVRSALGELIQFTNDELSIKNLNRLTISSPQSLTDPYSLGLSTLRQVNEIASALNDSGFSNKLESLTVQNIPGIGDWLLKRSAFLEWESSTGRTLWCNGLPGTGKTFFCSGVINYLRQKYLSTKVPILYAFLNPQEKTKQKPADVAKALFGQLLQQSGRAPVLLRSLTTEKQSGSLHPVFQDILSAFVSTIAEFDRVFVILDGIDEYADYQEEFTTYFQGLLKLSQTNVLFTSRHTASEVVLSNRLSKTILGDLIEFEIYARLPELRKFIQHKISQSRFANDIELETQGKRSHGIVEAILDRSGGVFLHARLLVESALCQPSITALKQYLLETNQNILKLYDNQLERLMQMPTEQTRYLLETLMWITYSLKPFTIAQLHEAVSIEVGSDDFHPEDLPFIEKLEQTFAGLIFVHEDRKEVSLLHYSLNEHLQEYLPRVKHLLPSLHEPHAVIVKKCLTCLRFKQFSLVAPLEPADLGDRLKRYAILEYAAIYWGQHAHKAPLDMIIEDVLTLFDSSANTMAAGLIMSTRENHPTHYEQAYRGMMGLHISAYFGLDKIIEYMLENRKVDPNVATVGGWTALHWAARRGWKATVESLLTHGASNKASTKLDGWTALHLAAKEGHLEIVMALVQSNVDVNATDVLKRTALYLATWTGQSDIVYYLLENSANPDIPMVYGATALHCAAKKGNKVIVRHLVDRVADVNTVDSTGLTALDEAVKRQSEDIIRILVEKGAKSKKRNDIWSRDLALEDLSWDTYNVNLEATRRIQRGSQCVCHVLEKKIDPEYDGSEQILTAFRKTYSFSKDTEGYVRKYFESERVILHRIQHPNVVTYLDFDEDPEQNVFFLYTEYCNLGDLFTSHGLPGGSNEDDEDDEEDEDSLFGFYGEKGPRSTTGTTPLSGSNIWAFVAQIASALAYLHYGLTVRLEANEWRASFEGSWAQIIHRDIKPENVVMQESESSIRIFKLCDLGIASEAGKGTNYNTTRLIGTREYRPPEVLKNKRWTTKGDIWAFGETIRNTNKLKDDLFETDTKLLIDRCSSRLQKARPSSLQIMEQAKKILDDNNVLSILPLSQRLQIEATHAILDGEGGYMLRAFNLVADMLDDIVPFEDEESQLRRKATLERLDVLWKDGADTPFLSHLNELSIHILALIPLSQDERKKHLDKAISSKPGLNNPWRRSHWTPLHLAAQAGNQLVVEILLAHGANKNAKDLHGRTPSSYLNCAEDKSLLALLQPNATGGGRPKCESPEVQSSRASDDIKLAMI